MTLVRLEKGAEQATVCRAVQIDIDIHLQGGEVSRSRSHRADRSSPRSFDPVHLALGTVSKKRINKRRLSDAHLADDDARKQLTGACWEEASTYVLPTKTEAAYCIP